jgi:hypothetical protein
MFRQKRSPEKKENAKSIIERRNTSEIIQREETYPEATGLCLLA